MRPLLVAALVLACQRGPSGEPTRSVDAGVPAESHGGGGVGVQVALPDEWSFFAAADGSLRAGPKGRTVLRIDPAPPGAKLASPDELFRSFQGGLSGLSARTMKTEQAPNYSGLQLVVVHERAGRGVQHRVYLGARLLQGRVFLCASAPGSSPAEVAEAADTCRGLSARERTP